MLQQNYEAAKFKFYISDIILKRAKSTILKKDRVADRVSNLLIQSFHGICILPQNVSQC